MQFLQFGMHSNLLRSVISDQAGSLTKAIVEGVMNSVDAGASKVVIQLTPERFTIEDDGRGIQTLEDLKQCFQYFGTPQTEEKVYGRYRMGRGQLFAFARNTWETGPFRMVVDIRNDTDLGFHLEQDRPASPGCKITGELYNRLNPQSYEETIKDLTQAVAYVAVPVVLNGEAVSRPPTKVKWDLETDDGYFKLSPSASSFKVYNRGVYVMSESPARLGTGGVFVSKQELRVNFARNEILYEKCLIWPRVRHELVQASLRKALSAPRLTAEQRRHLCEALGHATHDRLLSRDFLKLKLLTDVTGKVHSLDVLLKASRLIVADDKDAAFGAAVHRSGKAFVIGRETLEHFGCWDGRSLLNQLARIFYEGRFREVEVSTLAVDEGARAAAFKVISPEDLNPREKLAWRALDGIWLEFCQKLQALDCGQLRLLHPGQSALRHEAWTDGATMTVINRRLLRKIASRGMPEILRALQILVHEQCHDTSDLESHSHGSYFFQKYHDVTVDNMAMIYDFATRVRKAFRQLESEARRGARQSVLAASAEGAFAEA